MRQRAYVTGSTISRKRVISINSQLFIRQFIFGQRKKEAENVRTLLVDVVIAFPLLLTAVTTSKPKRGIKTERNENWLLLV